MRAALAIVAVLGLGCRRTTPEDRPEDRIDDRHIVVDKTPELAAIADAPATTPRPASVTDEILAAGIASTKRKAKLAADLATVDCAHAAAIYTADWNQARAGDKAWRQATHDLDQDAKRWLAHELARDPAAVAFTAAITRCAQDPTFVDAIDKLAAAEKSD